MARPRVHLGITLATLAFIGEHLSWAERGAFIAGGVLVDGDHLVDYALQRRAGGRDLLVLPLHGWEFALLAILGVGSRHRFGPAPAAGAGLLLHLLIDQLTNRPAHPALYSISFRLARRFAVKRLTFLSGDGGWMRQPWWRWF